MSLCGLRAKVVQHVAHQQAWGKGVAYGDGGSCPIGSVGGFSGPRLCACREKRLKD